MGHLQAAAAVVAVGVATGPACLHFSPPPLPLGFMPRRGPTMRALSARVAVASPMGVA